MSPSILTHLSALEDPRQHAKVLYPLVEILLLALSATIAEADDFVEITLWGEENQTFLRRFFAYANGIPSHDTRATCSRHRSRPVQGLLPCPGGRPS
jgi:hypothetical protein